MNLPSSFAHRSYACRLSTSISPSRSRLADASVQLLSELHDVFRKGLGPELGVTDSTIWTPLVPGLHRGLLGTDLGGVESASASWTVLAAEADVSPETVWPFLPNRIHAQTSATTNKTHPIITMTEILAESDSPSTAGKRAERSWADTEVSSPWKTIRSASCNVKHCPDQWQICSRRSRDQHICLVVASPRLYVSHVLGQQQFMCFQACTPGVKCSTFSETQSSSDLHTA